MVIVLNIGIWLISILIYIIWNQYKRNEKLEEIAAKQADFISETKNTVDQVTKMFDTIDEQQIFRANDYVGHMWLELKALNEALKNYK
jgi:hypothetical protein